MLAIDFYKNHSQVIFEMVGMMARPLQVENPGAFYQVINRGNAGGDIFKSLRDREKFLEYVALTATQNTSSSQLKISHPARLIFRQRLL